MGVSNSGERYIIDTASGIRLDLDDPRSEDIRIEDVAGGLSKVCRFGAPAPRVLLGGAARFAGAAVGGGGGIPGAGAGSSATTTRTKRTCATYPLPSRAS
jgi:hypothetical protein